MNLDGFAPKTQYLSHETGTLFGAAGCSAKASAVHTLDRAETSIVRVGYLVDWSDAVNCSIQ